MDNLHISSHNPNFVTVFVNVRAIFTEVGVLVLHPAEARFIDFVTGLQFFRRLGWSLLWCGILSGCLPRGRLEFGSYGCFNRPYLRFRLLFLGCFLSRNRSFFLLCQCCWFLNFRNGRFLGAHSGFCGWDGCLLGCVVMRPHGGAQSDTSGNHCHYDEFLHFSSSLADVKRALNSIAVRQETERSFS